MEKIKNRIQIIEFFWKSIKQKCWKKRICCYLLLFLRCLFAHNDVSAEGSFAASFNDVDRNVGFRFVKASLSRR